MEVPKGLGLNLEKKVCKLKKSIYGLKQAPRQWNKKVDAFFRNFGMIRSMSDTCVYYRNDGKTLLLVGIYVDDLLILSNDNTEMEKLKVALSSEFEMKDLGEASHLLGMEILRHGGKTIIKQEKYAKEILRRLNVENCSPARTSMEIGKKIEDSGTENVSGKDKIPYREAVGSLMYLATCTRPDLAMAVSDCSRFLENFGEDEWRAVKRIFRYLRGP